MDREVKGTSDNQQCAESLPARSGHGFLPKSSKRPTLRACHGPAAPCCLNPAVTLYSLYR